jgi:hypothetical protein
MLSDLVSGRNIGRSLILTTFRLVVTSSSARRSEFPGDVCDLRAEVVRLREKGSMPRQNWLSDMDSNHDKLLQRELCYHYTIGQTAL